MIGPEPFILAALCLFLAGPLARTAWRLSRSAFRGRALALRLMAERKPEYAND